MLYFVAACGGAATAAAAAAASCAHNAAVCCSLLRRQTGPASKVPACDPTAAIHDEGLTLRSRAQACCVYGHRARPNAVALLASTARHARCAQPLEAQPVCNKKTAPPAPQQHASVLSIDARHGHAAPRASGTATLGCGASAIVLRGTSECERVDTPRRGARRVPFATASPLSLRVAYAMKKLLNPKLFMHRVQCTYNGIEREECEDDRMQQSQQCYNARICA